VWTHSIAAVIDTLLTRWPGRQERAPLVPSATHRALAPPSQVTTALLITKLAGDLQPTSPHVVGKRLLIGAALGAGVSMLLLSLSLGYRPDLVRASVSPVFWVKLAYAIALFALSLRALQRLSRPGRDARARRWWLAAPIAAVLAVAFWQLAQVAPAERMPMVVGQTAAVCPWYVFLFAMPPSAGLLWALRGLAPTRLALTGATVGIAAGGAGAGIYALHCAEATIPFMAVWYTLGVSITAMTGAAVGSWLLRW